MSRVLLIPPPGHGAQTHHQSTHAEILERVYQAGVPVEGPTSADAVIGSLSHLKGDEIVLLLSSGPLLGLPDRLPAVMDRLYG
uniref:Uncharacterized protein n=1 Tax=Phenylobacterium glaciei TaxID=2803784 RepID=A0A974P5W9_9CAUL|nr:hypothetical protein JKL49_13525 [Phenylobacterium glaciei]